MCQWVGGFFFLFCFVWGGWGGGERSLHNNDPKSKHEDIAILHTMSDVCVFDLNKYVYYGRS